jgi:hypothetical protein
VIGKRDLREIRSSADAYRPAGADFDMQDSRITSPIVSAFAPSCLAPSLGKSADLSTIFAIRFHFRFHLSTRQKARGGKF